MMVNGSKIHKSDQEKEDKSGQMVPCTKVGGNRIRPTEREDLFMLMEMSMTATGLTIKHMGMVSIAISMEPSTKGGGKKINNTVKELRRGLIMLGTKVTTSKAKSTAPASSAGLMVALTTELSLKIISRVKDNIIGRMGEIIKASG